jgi:hypothetical protein
MNNYEEDLRGGNRQFDDMARVDGSNIVKPFKRFDSGSVACQPEAATNFESRASNQPLSQITPGTIESELQTQLCDTSLLPESIYDDYFFPSGNLTHGLNNNTAQHRQNNNTLTTDVSINSLGHPDILDPVWRANGTICDNSYVDSQYTQSGVGNIPFEYKYISPELLLPDLTSDKPVSSTDENSKDRNNRKSRQPAWGGSRPSYNSTSGSTTPISSSWNIAESSDSARRFSVPSPLQAVEKSPQTPSDDTKPKDLRASHNMIEKQYRTRLNEHFEILLRTLPPSTTSYNGDSGHRDNTSSERKVSKAEVLMIATRYIQSLETESRRLKGDNEQLKLKKEELENAYVSLGGTRMP